MLILYKISEINVPLVPGLSRCVYNGRLEIWLPKDWELQYIHSIEVLEMMTIGSHRNSLQLPDLLPCESKSLVFGHVNAMQSISLGQGPGTQEKYLEESRYYVMGFDCETLQRYAKLKSEEAVNLIEKHCCALLGNEQTGMLETRGMILTSFLRAKRLVLEAVAIGSFVWGIEQYVDTLYKL
ncbi:hypothetical protein DITRI_Ditri13aG0120400 [Diplodiscus trichospermus]